MNAGDAIATVAQPIVRGIDYVFGTDVQNCQGCKQRQQQLNRFFNKQKGSTMQFIVTRQIAVEAESPEDAVTKLAEGQTISLSINPRPQSIQRPAQPTTIKP